ncbi:unnamed protein product [Brassica oleracea]|uniref:Uncharacterized protein n=1 Tax=Brassica oleracea TaxID=3712 RepID=A0A3P6G5F4_BRAOL|nr:unnamed protein product [Brassica oleracea]
MPPGIDTDIAKRISHITQRCVYSIKDHYGPSLRQKTPF